MNCALVHVMLLTSKAPLRLGPLPVFSAKTSYTTLLKALTRVQQTCLVLLQFPKCFQACRKRGGPPVFGRPVNPISTRGDTLFPPSTTCPPPDFQTLRRPCTIVLIILKLYQVTSLFFNFGHIRLWCNVWAT